MATAEYETSGLENKRREWAWWWKKEIKNKKKWTSRNERKRHKWRRVLKEKSLSIFCFFQRRNSDWRKKKRIPSVLCRSISDFFPSAVIQKEWAKENPARIPNVSDTSFPANHYSLLCNLANAVKRILSWSWSRRRWSALWVFLHSIFFHDISFGFHLSLSLSGWLVHVQMTRRQKRQEKNQNTKWK
jgi:hypothetical protein